MSTVYSGDVDELGGRLRLLPVDELDCAQAAIHARLRTWFARANRAGYQTALPDGRLLGPFNSFIRTPAVGGPHLDWAEAISSIGLPEDIREVVILTVGAEWHAAYMLDAHSLAARKAGVGDQDIAAIRAGSPAVDLGDDADLAHRFTIAIVRDHDVPDDLYAEMMERFGETTTTAVVALIGQYLTTSALLTCFRVPAPPDLPA